MNPRYQLQKFLPSYPFRRNYNQALSWLSQIRNKILTDKYPKNYIGEFGLLQQSRKDFSDSALSQILDITTFSEFDKTYSRANIEDIFFANNLDSKDSINNPIIQKLIKKALESMQDSMDPAHGFTHILRTAHFGWLLYQDLKKQSPDLDWGIVATAIAWHDIYRINHVGFLYSKDNVFRKIWRNFFLIQDLIIYSIHKQDSVGSCLIFLKSSKKILPNDLRLKIAIAILGEHKLEFLEEKVYPGILTYKNIIFCADVLDLITIGRWEETHRNVITRGLADTKFLNRMIVLNILFNVPKVEKKLNIKAARKIYALIGPTLLNHLKEFYPDDAEFWHESSKSKGG
jgi:hypothetical protein